MTTEPNEFLKPIHNRMPVILGEKDHEMWLDPDYRDSGRLLSILQPYPAEEMEAYLVSERVNNPKKDDEGCVRRAE